MRIAMTTSLPRDYTTEPGKKFTYLLSVEHPDAGPYIKIGSTNNPLKRATELSAQLVSGREYRGSQRFPAELVEIISCSCCTSETDTLRVQLTVIGEGIEPELLHRFDDDRLRDDEVYGSARVCEWFWPSDALWSLFQIPATAAHA